MLLIDANIEERLLLGINIWSYNLLFFGVACSVDVADCVPL